MSRKIFPIRVYLHVLQLEEYSVIRFYRWFFKNILTRSLGDKKPLIVTSKVKNILILSILLFVITLFILTKLLGILGILISVLLLTQFHLYLSLALIFYKPYEILNRILVKKSLKKRIIYLKSKGLKVIGITGSYGKTSVKEALFEILKKDFKVLRTPGSYNTLFGIKKVVDIELDESYDFFICEMGAYTIGEIRELCETFLPDFGILTGINEQHIERFGSIGNTIKAKFELAQCVGDKSKVLLNFDNENVLKNADDFIKGYKTYGVRGKDFKIEDIAISNLGSSFSVKLSDNTYDIKTPLVGFSKISNITSAFSMALMVGQRADSAKEAVKNITPVPHRLEIKALDGGTILIDDAYSANVSGFYEALDVLDLFKDKTKVVVTPGIVELGEDLVPVHKKIGNRIDEVSDFCFLIGENNRTKAIKEGLNNTKYVFLDSINKIWDELRLRFEMGSELVVLLENDLPDNY